VPAFRALLVAASLWLLADPVTAQTSSPFQTAPHGTFPYEIGSEPLWTEADSNSLLPCAPLDSCFCSRPNCYFGSASLSIVALERLQRPDAHDIFYVDNPATMGLDFDNPVGNAQQLDLSTKVGVRFDMILPSKCGCDLNINVLAVHDSRNTLTADDANVFYWFYNAAPATLEASYTAQYESDLGSVELNIRTRQARRLAPLAGFRVLELEETFNISSAAGSVTSKADNVLFGVQFGMQGLLLNWKRWRLETSLKAGAFHNDIDLIAQAENGEINQCFSHIAFVGDLQLTASYQVAPRLLVRVGYQGLWLEGMALAPDQTDNGAILLGRATVDLGTAIYQGGFIGGEFTY